MQIASKGIQNPLSLEVPVQQCGMGLSRASISAPSASARTTNFVEPSTRATNHGLLGCSTKTKSHRLCRVTDESTDAVAALMRCCCSVRSLRCPVSTNSLLFFLVQGYSRGEHPEKSLYGKIQPRLAVCLAPSTGKPLTVFSLSLPPSFLEGRETRLVLPNNICTSLFHWHIGTSDVAPLD